MKDRASEIFQVLTDVYGTSPWSLQQIINDLNQDSTDYFFERESGELVGFLAIQNLVGELEITNIAVRKSHQGRGIAKCLMKNLDDHLETVFLEVRESNLAAQALYRSCGFEVIGKRKSYYANPLEDAIIMRRESK